MGLRLRLRTVAVACLYGAHQCRHGTNDRDSAHEKLPLVADRKGWTRAMDMNIGALDVHGVSRILRREAA